MTARLGRWRDGLCLQQQTAEMEQGWAPENKRKVVRTLPLAPFTTNVTCASGHLTEEIGQPEPMMNEPISTDTRFWGLSSCQIPATLNPAGIAKCPSLGTAKSLGLWCSRGSSDHDLQASPAGPVLLWAEGRVSGKHCSPVFKLIYFQGWLCEIQNETQQKQPLHRKCDQEKVVEQTRQRRKISWGLKENISTRCRILPAISLSEV